MDFKIPQFKTDKELFDFLVNKESDIFYAKMQSFKKADGFMHMPVATKEFTETGKRVNLIEKDEFKVNVVINTTNLLDSHGDVHVKGLWDKSLQENTRIKHLQEHRMSFDSIIADKEDLEVYVKDFTWKELGYNVEGKTQALVFNSAVKRERNAYMHEQYAKGNVDNHSVGMRYVKLVTCINDEDYGAEFEAWEKYAPLVANQAELEKRKYFWAVTEAKCIEGSAVPIGSNFVTPTISIKDIEVGDAKEIKVNRDLEAIKNWLSI